MDRRGHLFRFAVIFWSLSFLSAPTHAKTSGNAPQSKIQPTELKDEKSELQIELPFKRIAILSFESKNGYLSGENLCLYFKRHFLKEFPEVAVIELKNSFREIAKSNVQGKKSLASRGMKE